MKVPVGGTHNPPCHGPGDHVTPHKHPSCVAHIKEPRVTLPGRKVRHKGEACTRAPHPGGTVCYLHGGRASQVVAKAEANLQQAEAQAAVELFAARRDIEPGQALLELVQWTAGEVDYWRQEVRQVERDALVWGVTREKTGGSVPDVAGPDDEQFVAAPEVTREAKPNVAYQMLIDAQNRLAAYCVAAIKAGVAERQIRLAEQQGALLADVIRAILADLHLTKAQQALVATVVPAHLRAITGGAA